MQCSALDEREARPGESPLRARVCYMLHLSVIGCPPCTIVCLKSRRVLGRDFRQTIVALCPPAVCRSPTIQNPCMRHPDHTVNTYVVSTGKSTFYIRNLTDQLTSTVFLVTRLTPYRS